MAVKLEQKELDALNQLDEYEQKQIEDLAEKLFPIIYEKIINKIGAYLVQ